MYLMTRNVDTALRDGYPALVASNPIATSPRGEPTIEYDGVWVTRYERPWERVSLSPARDANPFFHFMEAMWILAGRNDVKFLADILDHFKNFSDNGVSLHGAYGYRLGRKLLKIIDMLKTTPDTRRAVCSIWDDDLDLGRDSADIPCNDMLVFRIRNGRLDMTVYNRSNDMVLGAYGANAVHFAFIMEYVAERVGVPMGVYTQVSNSMHVYLGERYLTRLKDWEPATNENFYDTHQPGWTAMGSTDAGWDLDLAKFFSHYDFSIKDTHRPGFKTPWFTKVVWPMWMALQGFKSQGASKELAEWCMLEIGATDWAVACYNWLMRRVK